MTNDTGPRGEMAPSIASAEKVCRAYDKLAELSSLLAEPVAEWRESRMRGDLPTLYVLLWFKRQPERVPIVKQNVLGFVAKVDECARIDTITEQGMFADAKLARIQSGLPARWDDPSTGLAGTLKLCSKAADAIRHAATAAASELRSDEGNTSPEVVALSAGVAALVEFFVSNSDLVSDRRDAEIELASMRRAGVVDEVTMAVGESVPKHPDALAVEMRPPPPSEDVAQTTGTDGDEAKRRQAQGTALGVIADWVKKSPMNAAPRKSDLIREVKKVLPWLDDSSFYRWYNRPDWDTVRKAFEALSPSTTADDNAADMRDRARKNANLDSVPDRIPLAGISEGEQRTSRNRG